MLLFAAWPKVNCNHDEDWWVWRKKCKDVLSSATSMKMFYHSCRQHRRNWCHTGLPKASHAISTINECLSVRQDADEVGGQTTLNMQIQADISLLLLGDNTLSIIRYGIMNWDGPYFRCPLKSVMHYIGMRLILSCQSGRSQVINRLC